MKVNACYSWWITVIHRQEANTLNSGLTVVILLLAYLKPNSKAPKGCLGLSASELRGVVPDLVY